MATPRESCEGDVRLFAQAAAFPTLTDPEVSEIAGRALVLDSAGIRPGQTGYTDTFDRNRALALACELKAAKAAGNYDFSSGGQSFKRSQVMAFWKAEAEKYRKRSSAGASSLAAAGSAAFSPTTGAYIGRGGLGSVDASDVEGDNL